jgi:hypothetical protein
VYDALNKYAGVYFFTSNIYIFVDTLGANMSKFSELEKIAQDRQISVPELLTVTLESAGSIDGAADALSKYSPKPIYANTVRHALKKHGLRFSRIVIGKVESAEVDHA